MKIPPSILKSRLFFYFLGSAIFNPLPVNGDESPSQSRPIISLHEIEGPTGESEIVWGRRARKFLPPRELGKTLLTIDEVSSAKYTSDDLDSREVKLAFDNRSHNSYEKEIKVIQGGVGVVKCLLGLSDGDSKLLSDLVLNQGDTKVAVFVDGQYAGTRLIAELLNRSKSFVLHGDQEKVLQRHGVMTEGEYSSFKALQNRLEENTATLQKAIDAGWISDPFQIAVLTDSYYFVGEPIQIVAKLSCRPIYNLRADPQSRVFDWLEIGVPNLDGDPRAVFEFRLQDGTKFVDNRTEKNSQTQRTGIPCGESRTVLINVSKLLGLEYSNTAKLNFSIAVQDVGTGTAWYRNRTSRPVAISSEIIEFERTSFDILNELAVDLTSGSRAKVEIGTYDDSVRPSIALFKISSDQRPVQILKIPESGGSKAQRIESLWETEKKRLHILWTPATERDGQVYVVTESDLAGIASSERFVDRRSRVLRTRDDGTVELRLATE